MKKVLIVSPKDKIEKGVRPEYTFLKETDFTDKEGNALLENSGLVIIKKKRK